MSKRPAKSAASAPPVKTGEFKLEVVVPAGLRCRPGKGLLRANRLEARRQRDCRNGSRLVQLTPPGSGCSIQFGTNISPATPGSAQSLYLIVSDIEPRATIWWRAAWR